MKLVMVHGREQGGRNPKELTKEWVDALSYGLSRANSALPRGTEVLSPYYGDILQRLVSEIDTVLSSQAMAKGAQADIDRAFRGEMLQEIALTIGLTPNDIAREFTGEPTMKGPLNWAWVQATLRALDKVPGLNSQAIDAFTRDVYVYLTYPGVRASIDGIVAEVMDDEPCVVVAHSLGTVVAYNVLCARDATPHFPRYITLGSPLGIKAIKRHIERPLRVPHCVGDWFNAYDDRDVVALVPLDTRNFPVTPPIENKSDVKNFTDNRHGISGYLADPIVARKIVELLH
jgi:hypothetical protein